MIAFSCVLVRTCSENPPAMFLSRLLRQASAPRQAIGQAQMADEDAVSKMLEKFKPGEGVSFEVLVDVWPEAKLSGDYTGITVSCFLHLSPRKAALNLAIVVVKSADRTLR